jgi:hypothetical protein
MLDEQILTFLFPFRLSLPAPPKEHGEVVSKYGDIFVTDAIAKENIDLILNACKEEFHAHFQRAQANYADLDEIRLVSRGELPQNEHQLALVRTALSDSVINAIGRAFNEEKSLFLRELVIFRMGPGCYNGCHSHKVFTANILLQDNPREEGKMDGLFFTAGYRDKADKLDQWDGMEMVGNNIYPRYYPAQVGALHARKSSIQHGVAKIQGERDLTPNPEICRYVLAYVYEKPILATTF